MNTRFGLKPTSAPAFEPVTLDEAKLHLRLDASDDDLLVQTALTAARELCEAHTGRCFTRRSYLLTLDAFPAAGACPGVGTIELPQSPLVSVASVQYVDDAGVPQTLSTAGYVVDDVSSPPRLAPVTTWPATRQQVNAVKFAFTVGYATSADVPGVVKSAIKLLLGHLYENREAVGAVQIYTELPLGAKALLDTVAVSRF